MLKKIWHFFFPQKVDSENVQFDIDRSKFSIGSILLALVLGIFLLSQTERALFEVNKFLDEPICPVLCSEIDLENSSKNPDYYSYSFRQENPTEYARYESRYQEVSVLEIYPELHSEYVQLHKNYLSLDNKRDQVQDLERMIRDLERQNEQERKNYETGLLEDIADSEERAFESEIKRSNINSARSQILSLNSQLSKAKQEESSLENDFKAGLASFKSVHDLALQKYISAKRSYGLKLMLTRLMLTLPLLLIGTWWYRRSQEKQSKYVILPLVLMVVGAITFLQVVAMYASNWIPFDFFERLFGWLMELAFGTVIVHYIIVFGGVFIVGGLIISIQKKLFSGKRQSLRRLNKGECPFCAFPMKHSDEFCAGCGEELKITCAQCQKPTLKMLAHCQHCGKNPKKIVE